MVRTQIQLTEQQLRRLRAKARELGISLAEMIRRCVDSALADEINDRAELYERASRVIGRFPDTGGVTNLAQEHDSYLEKAFE